MIRRRHFEALKATGVVTSQYGQTGTLTLATRMPVVIETCHVTTTVPHANAAVFSVAVRFTEKETLEQIFLTRRWVETIDQSQQYANLEELQGVVLPAGSVLEILLSWPTIYTSPAYFYVSYWTVDL